VRFLGDDFVFLDLRCKWFFFFFGAKICQNENIKIKKEYYVTIFSLSLSLFKEWSNFEEKNFEFVWPH